MKKCDLPKELKVSLIDILTSQDSHLADMVGEAINNYLYDTYNAIPSSYLYDDTIEMSNIEWEVED